MLYSPGDVAIFVRSFDGVDWGLDPGDFVGVANVDPEGPLICYRLDWRGRVFEQDRHLVFPEELRPVPAPPIPTRRFPVPWGASDNEERDSARIWTGCPVGCA